MKNFGLKINKINKNNKFVFLAILVLFIFVPQITNSTQTTFTTSLTTTGLTLGAPSIPLNLIANAVSSSQIDLSWTASIPNYYPVDGYRIFRDGLFLATTSSIVYSDTGLSPETNYDYTVEAFDTMVQLSGQSAIATATTTAVPVPTPTPTPSVGGGSSGSGSTSGIIISNIKIIPGTNQAEVSFNTSIQAQSSLSWGFTNYFEMGSLQTLSYNFAHTQTITGLTEGLTYQLKITAKGPNGELVSTNTSFTTVLPISELGPLPNPLDFIAEAGEKDITLNWTNPEDPRFNDVRIVRTEGFYPVDQFDGLPLYEGDGESFVDTTAKPGVTYYYAIFSRDNVLQYSSGALAQARIALPGEIATTTVVDPFANIPQAKNVDPKIRALTLSDFEFIQEGKNLATIGETVAINGDKNLTIRLKYEKVPEILKTVAFTLKDPNDSTRVFPFLLRINSDKTAYEATIGALGKSGRYGMSVTILDYENNGLMRLDGTLAAMAFTPVINFDNSFDLLGLLILFLIIILIILAIILVRKWIYYSPERSREYPNTKKVLVSILALIFAGSVVLSSVFGINKVFAAINPQINYQGKLTNSSNAIVADGNYNIRFKLYTSLSGGVPVWTETWCNTSDCAGTGIGADNRIPLSSGLFSTMLGSTTSLVGVDFNQPLYLGVEIGGSGAVASWDGEMSPRKIIGTVPAAFVAESANTLSGLNSEQFLRSDAQNATSSSSTFLNVIQTGAGKIAEFFGSASQSVLALLSNGNVGIGSTTPFGKLSVASFNNGTQPQFIIASSTGSSATSTAFIVNYLGNVGIGLSNPETSLVVAGASTTDKQSFFSVDNMQLSQLNGGAYFGGVGIKENSIALNNYGVTWTARDSSRNWNGIAMSSDGKIQTAVDSAPGQIYTSTDYGVTWTARDSSRGWSAVAMSSDGKIQTAVVFGGQIYTSTDYGVTWTARESSRNWRNVAMSSDGKIQTATVLGGQIYTSTDYGVTWTARDSIRDWFVVAMSSDGKIQTATVQNGQIYTSTNYGVTWTARDSSRNWRGSAMSSDGKIQTATVNGGQIYTSTDYGVTWTARDSSRAWSSVDMSSDGKIQTAVVAFGQIYTSTDYGVTWTARDSSRFWFDIAMSSDGKIQTAVVFLGGQIYTSSADSYNPYGNFAIGTSSPYSSLSVWGLGTGTRRLFELTNSASTTLLSVLENGTSYFLGNVGVGTTSPFYKLSVEGTSSLGNQAIAGYFTSTSTTAISTFPLLTSTTATTTNLAVTSITSSLLKTNSLGQLVAATAGTDYANFGYLFPSNATTTLLSFNGGLTSYASTTIGNGTQTGGLTINGGATTTGNAYFAGNVGIGTTTPTNLLDLYGSVNGNVRITARNTSTGNLSNAGFQFFNNGSAYFGGGVYGTNHTVTTLRNNALFYSSHGMEFVAGDNGSANTIAFSHNGIGSKGLILNSAGNVGIGSTTPFYKLSVEGSSSLGNQAIAGYFTATSSTAISTFPLLTSTTATTTNLAVTSITSSLLKTNSLGQLVAATAGTDYANFGYLFPLNATTTLLSFDGGLTSYASTTIGAGGQATGLTINGGATTTGNAYFAGNVGIGTTSPFAKFAINPVAGDVNQFVVGSSSRTSFIINSAGNVGIGLTNPQTSLVVAGASTTDKQSFFSVDNMQLSQLNGGSYFGGVGIKENSIALNNYGVNWIARDSSRGWNNIAMSSDGKIQTATVNGGQIYTSTDYGVTWTARDSSRTWWSVAISSDGKIQTAVDAAPGQIYTSTDYGVTWTARDSNRSWRDVAISSDGKIQTAVVNSGQIYTSTDYGVTWTARDSNRGWNGVAISSDGKIQTAVVFIGQIYISTDYGVTWTARDSSRFWDDVAISSDGKIQTAVVLGGQIYTSTDYGVTWTGRDSNRSWNGIAMSSDGKIQTATALFEKPFTSTDYGVTWTGRDSNRSWNGIAMSSDGKIQTATVNAGQIYTSSADSYNPYGNFAIGTSSPYSTLSVWGGGTGANRLFELTNSASTTLLSVLENGTSYFLGNVGIGSTTPFYKLSVEGTSSLGNQAIAGYFTATSTTASVFPYASTTALTVSGTDGLRVGTLTGILQGINGTVSASSTLSVAYGGTGLSTAPTYGQLLLGQSNGTYTLVSTSSLGISSTGSTFDYLFPSNATTTLLSFNGGLTSYASTTIGNGTQTGGLTINGGATTTGNAYFAGNVGIGTSNPFGQLSISDGNAIASGLTSALSGPYIVGSASGAFDNVLISASNAATTRAVSTMIKSRGTLGSPTAVQSNDTLGTFLFGGYDGSQVNFGGGLFAYADGNASAGNTPTRLSFVTGNNGTDRTEKLVIKSTGNIGIGSTTPFGKLSVVSFNNGTQPQFVIASSTGSSATSTAFIVNHLGNVGIGLSNPETSLVVAGASTTNKQSFLSVDNIQLSQLNGGSYFGGVGIKENSIALNNYGVTWTARDSNRYWKSVAMSSDGKIQTAVDSAPGQIYTSTDYGVTWTPRDSSRGWSAVAMSSDGKIQTALVSAGQIYTSTDYGVTWTSRDSSRNWYGIDMSSDGKIQTATVQNGQIYTSTNYGVTWTARESSRNWRRIAMSSDGKMQTVVVFGGQIYTSTDYGVTWTARDSSRNWFAIAMSSDSKIQTAVVDGGQIYTSTDYGVTWTARDSNKNWVGIAMSSDGKIQTAVVNGGLSQIHTSIDYGVTWIPRDVSQGWFDIAMSSDGKIQTAVVFLGGQIYTSSANSYNPYGNFAIGTSSPYSTLSVWGSGTGTNRLFELTNSASTTLLSVLENGTSYFLGNVGIGSTTPWGKLAINPIAGDVNQFVVGSSTRTSFIINSAGNVGIGTTSPTYKLSVQGTSFLGSQATAGYFTSTSVNATSTFAGNISLGLQSFASNNSMAGGKSSFLGGAITASGNGSLAWGSADSSGGAITSSGDGSIAFGYGYLQATNRGSFAFGYGDTQFGGEIYSTGYGSFAGGYSSTGSVTASGNTSFAFGDNITASNSRSVAFGNGFTNSQANSFMVGYSATPTLTVNATGVGIGSTTPLYKLSVEGTSSLGNQAIAGYFTSTSTTAISTFPLLTSTTATTTNLAVTSITSSLLKTNSLGQLVAATAGTDYANFGYLFPGNATSTLLSFDGGLTSYASTTIGNGTQTGGLTINGGATTTGNAYFAGNVGIGTTTPWAKFAINPVAGDGNSFVIGSSTATNFVVTNAGNVGVGTSTPGAKLSIQGGNLNGLPQRVLEVIGITSSSNSGGIYMKTGDSAYNAGNIDFIAGSSGETNGGSINLTAGNGSSFGGVDGNITLNPGTQVGNGKILLATTGGNVGIGSTTPLYKLSVEGTSSLGNQAIAGYFTSTSTTAISTFPLLTSTTATTTNLAVTSITSSLLKTNSLGQLVAATAGTDYANFGYLFPGNATSTLLSFDGGLTSYASTTIGNGTQTGGLTINGGATTTGNAYFASSVGIGTNNPQTSLVVAGASTTDKQSFLSVDNMQLSQLNGGSYFGGVGIKENSIALNNYGVNWTARDSVRIWFKVAMSSDGKIQTAVVYTGQIYTSTDYGVTWTARDSSRNWYGIAMSSDGKIQTAIVDGGQIYTSTDYGLIWTVRDSSRDWRDVAMSSDGKIQTAVVSNGQIYISADYGVTWTTRDSSRVWSAVAMSSDGKIQTATVQNGQIYTSTNYGVTWTVRDSSRVWLSAAMSSDGKIQTVVEYGGQIYTSTDYGVTWTPRGSSRSWRDVAMSSDGKIQTATVQSDQIYTSTDYGVTWIARSVSRVWEGVAMSSDGKIQTALVSFGQIYTSSADSYNPYGNFAIGTSSPYSSLSVWGLGTGTRRLFELTNSASTTLLSVLENGTSYFLGNVGVGTTSPFAKLSVSSFNGGTQPMFAIASSTGSSATSTAFIVNHFGNVGIGTVNPLTRLQVGQTTSSFATQTGTQGIVVGSNSSAVSFAGVNTAASSNVGGAFSLLYHDDGASMASGDRLGGFIFGGSVSSSALANSAGVAAYAESAWSVASTPTNLSFETASPGFNTRTEKMRITAAGNIGIGSTTPFGKLSVASFNNGTQPQFVIASSTGSSATSTSFIVNHLGNVGIGLSNPETSLVVAGASTTDKQSFLSVDNMQLSQLNGGSYFGGVGIKENSIALNNYGVNWIARDSNRNWWSIAVSSDGKIQTAVEYGGQIYTSTDYGVTWTARDSVRDWYGIAMSSDGKIQTAIINGGQIYTSTNYGVTWTARGSGVSWMGIAMSSDGKIQTALVSFGQVYTSTDYGVTWTARDSSRLWDEVAMSSDGKIQTATVFGGQIYTSTNYGVTWTARDSSRNWRDVAMSSDGKIQTVTVQGGQIYTSTNYGVTWTARDSSRNWLSFAMSSDGKIQTAAVYNGQIYISTDYGVTWTARDSDRAWGSVAMSSDGKIQTATVQSGQIYTSSADSYNPYGNFAIGTSSPYSTLSVWGLGTGTRRLFELTNNASTTLLSVLENGTSYFLGNVGVGTTSPFAKLSVAGNAYIGGDLTATGTVTIGTLTGPLQAINGIVSASSTLSVAYGGTGISTMPNYGQLLVGDGSGNYSLMATSTLGILASSAIGLGSIGQIPYYSTAEQAITATSSIFLATNSFVGIGTTTPTSALSVFSTVSPQFQLAYDKDNYLTTGVSSSGGVTLASNGTLGGFTITNPQPTAVLSGTGTAAPLGLSVTGGVGGNSSDTNVGVGGIGGGIQLNAGTGGTALFATFSETGGAGGAVSLAGGTGGAAASPTVDFMSRQAGAGGAMTLAGGAGGDASNGGTASSNTAGAGGAFILNGGVGGNASGATVNNGGAGGSLYITGGAGGTGSTANGSAGNVYLGYNSSSALGNVYFGNQNISYISSTGNFGISSTTPFYKLSVEGTSSLGNQAIAGYFTSTSTTAISTFPLLTSTTATTTNLAVTSITSSLLKTNSLGQLVAATAGTDYANFGYLFPGNATSTLLSFDGGLTSYASTTIGNGTQTGGLTINGGATTTGNAYFAGNVGIGTVGPVAKLHVVSDSDPAYIDRYSNDTSAPSLILRKARGTSASPSAVQLNDALGGFFARGYHSGGAFPSISNAAVAALAAENFTSTAQGTYLTFETTLIGGTSRTEKMRISDGGNVGIGTTSPLGKLSISSFNNGTQPQFVIASSTGSSATSTSFIVNHLGNVGIGTTSPASKLDIYSTSAPTDGLGVFRITDVGTENTGLTFKATQANSFFRMSAPTDIKFPAVFLQDGDTIAGRLELGRTTLPQLTSAIRNDLLLYNAVDGKSILFGTTNTTLGERMRIAANGNLGIGTTSPYAKLSVTGTSNTPTFALYGFNSQTSNLFLVASTTGSATSTAFVIDSNGKVGVGTTSPYTQLSVQGTIAGQNFSADNASATSTFAGGLSVGSGALNYDFSSGITSINALEMGALNFEQDAGQVSWADLMVTSASVAGMVQSYTAQINNNPILTIFGESDGVGGVRNTLAVGIGTTSPLHQLDILAGSTTDFTTGKTADYYGINVANQATSSTASIRKAGLTVSSTGTWNGASASNIGIYVSSVTGGTNNYDAIFNGGGNVGIGTTSPLGKLSISSFNNGTQPQFVIASSTGSSATSTSFIVNHFGNVGIGTANPLNKLSFGGGAQISSDTSDGSDTAYLGFTPSNWNGTGLISDRGGYFFTYGNEFATAGYKGRMTFGAGNTYTSGLDGAIVMRTGADVERMVILNNGNIGISSSTPLYKLSVEGTSSLGNQAIAGYFTATSTTATSTFAGGLEVGQGNLMYDFTTGVTSINSLQTGNINFDTDAGIISWVDLPVSSASSGTVQSYSAQIAGQSLLTVYGVSNGSGSISSGSVVIGTSTPYTAGLTVWGKDTVATTRSFDVLNNASSSLLTVYNDGAVKIGGTTSTTTINGYLDVLGTGTNSTSTIASNLWVKGNMRANLSYVGDLIFANNFAFTEGLPINSTTTQALYLKNQTGEKVLGIDDKGNMIVTGDICSKNFTCVSESLEKLTTDMGILASSTAGLQSGLTTSSSVQSLADAIVALDLKVDAFIASSTSDINSIIASTTLALASSTDFILNVSSSTANVLSANTSFVNTIAEAVKNILSNTQDWVVERFTAKVAYLNRVEAETVAISKGMEIVDQANGSVWCVTIKNGDWNKVQGSCVSVASTTNPVVATPTPTPVVPIIETPVTGSSTDTVSDSSATSTPETQTATSSDPVGNITSPETSTSTPSSTETTTSSTPTPSPTIEATPSPSPDVTPVETTPTPTESPVSGPVPAPTTETP